MTLRQQLIKALAATAAGQGGSADVFTPELDKQLAQGITALAGEPGARPAVNTITSDRPDPASEDI